MNLTSEATESSHGSGVIGVEGWDDCVSGYYNVIKVCNESINSPFFNSISLGDVRTNRRCERKFRLFSFRFVVVFTRAG
jgi:hypothetical protein